MAHKVCSADGVFSGSVWSAVDGTALISTSNAASSIGTSYTSSAVFNPTAITIDAIYIKVGRRDAGTATNTMTVSLWDSVGGAEVVAVTVAVNDLPVGAGTIGQAEDESGWVCLKLGSTPTLANNNHLIRIKVDSTSTSVAVRTNGTANNFQHMLRTTAAATTASAGDDLYIVGEYTTTATWTTRTLTYDVTASTDWGSGRVSSGAEYGPAIYVGQYGALNCGTTASTNYTLKVSGWIVVAPLGTFTWGTALAPIPTTCATSILFDNGASTVYSIAVAPTATFEMCGAPRTAGKNVVTCSLAADITSTTSWTVDTDTGWLSGDVVAMHGRGSTTALQSYTRTLASNAGATTLTMTADSPQGPYYGTGDEAARQRIILLTRNIRLYCTTTGQALGIRAATYSNRAPTKFSLQWVQFDDGVILNLQAAESLTAPNGPTTCEIAYCSWYRATGATASLLIGAMVDKFSIHDCGLYVAANLAINTWTLASSNQTYTFSFYNIVAFGQATNSGGSLVVVIVPTTGTVSNLFHACAVGATGISQPNTTAMLALNAGTYSGITSVYTAGFSFTNVGIIGSTLTNWKAYRCAATGFSLTGGVFLFDCVLDGWVAKGNATQGLLIGNSNRLKNVLFKQWTFGSESSPANFPQARGVEFNSISSGISDIWKDVWFDACSLGTSSTHSVADVSLGTLNSITNIAWYEGSGFRNCNLYSATELIGTTDSRQGTLSHGAYVPGCAISFIRNDGATGTSTTYLLPGANKRIRNSSIYRTAAPSEELQVVNATASTSPCHSSVRGVCVSSGSTVTASLYMRVSSTYTGAAPVVYLVPNGQLGWYTKAAIGTYAGTAGQADTFVAVTCSTSSTATDDGIAQFYVAAFGTVGSVYLDDWSFVVT